MEKKNFTSSLASSTGEGVCFKGQYNNTVIA